MKSPFTVLIVEDDHTSTVVASTMLNQRGYDVICAKNGRDGLEIAQSARVDLIILDLNLPLFSGQQFLNARAQCEVMKHIPCIVTSAHVQYNYIDDAKKLGANYYFTKPLDWHHLINRVEDLMNKLPSPDLAKAAV